MTSGQVDRRSGTSAATSPLIEIDGLSLVVPRFDGAGLANIPSTALRALTGSHTDLRLPPLDAATLPPRLVEGVRAVVLLVADGLGHLQLLREIEAGNAPCLASLLRAAAQGADEVAYQPITSVFPTTTVAALGTLNSGVAPAEHGLLAYSLYLPELGGAVEMIRWGPLGERGSFADAEHGEHAPEQFFWADTIYRRLHDAGVSRAYVVNPSHFNGQALSRMLHEDGEYHGYAATSSLGVITNRLLCDSDEPTFIYAYWPTVDTVAHVRGPYAEEHGAEVYAFDRALERFLDRLAQRGDTLLLLTADHGHVQTGDEFHVALNDHPDVVELLAVPPVGERRVAYLHAKPGEAAALEACARERLREWAVPLSRDEAIRLGLFGPGPIAERARARIGDVLLFPRQNLQIVYTPPTVNPPTKPHQPLFGMHGGLTPEEALVPLLAVRR